MCAVAWEHVFAKEYGPACGRHHRAGFPHPRRHLPLARPGGGVRPPPGLGCARLPAEEGAVVLAALQAALERGASGEAPVIEEAPAGDAASREAAAVRAAS